MAAYPPPSHALMVWLEASGVCVQIPHATDPQGPSHILRLGHSPEDYTRLIAILRARRDAPEARTIGTPAAPTQSQLEALAGALDAAAKAERAAERAQRARASAKVNATPDSLADFLLDD